MGTEGTFAPMLKGPVHKAVDNVVNSQDVHGHYDKRGVFLDGLKALQPPERDHTVGYLDLLMQPVRHGGAGVSRRQAEYLGEYWYGRDSFWSHYRYAFHPTEPIVRLGLIKAIELATQFNLPLDSYWVAAGEVFNTLVIHDAQQITRIVLTPPTPPHENPAALFNYGDIWVIKNTLIGPWEIQESPVWDNSLVITRLKKLP